MHWIVPKYKRQNSVAKTYCTKCGFWWAHIKKFFKTHQFFLNILFMTVLIFYILCFKEAERLLAKL